jgi:hypothetical protein
MSGPRLALLAAALFGLSAPAAKLLVGSIDPWLLAGLLYLGSGLGLAMVSGTDPIAVAALKGVPEP